MPRFRACLKPSLLRSEKDMVAMVLRGGMVSKPYSSSRISPIRPVKKGMGARPERILSPTEKSPHPRALANSMVATPFRLKVSTIPWV